MIKTYSLIKPRLNPNFALRISFDEMDNSKSISDDFSLLVDKVEVDYDLRTIRIGFSLDTLAKGHVSLKINTAIDALKLLNEKRQREITITEYSGRGTTLKSETFNCGIFDLSENPWEYTWYDCSSRSLTADY